MAQQMRTPRVVALDAAEIRRRCGDILDRQVEAILETGATAGDLAAALAWASGQDDLPGEERRPLTGVAGQVYDILAPSEELDDEDRRPPLE
jgi:hypothetical protein